MSVVQSQVPKDQTRLAGAGPRKEEKRGASACIYRTRSREVSSSDFSLILDVCRKKGEQERPKKNKKICPHIDVATDTGGVHMNGLTNIFFFIF